VDTIEVMIQKLNLSDAERMPNSYAGLFDIVRQNMELTMAHLTFDAFEGINVPAEAFIKQGETKPPVVDDSDD
ncbi:MAG: hypothetical protein KC708_20105, partial [Anaerolineae bacterium]|nr:hypothetical protein [Anaerolineae bacterium]